MKTLSSLVFEKTKDYSKANNVCLLFLLTFFYVSLLLPISSVFPTILLFAFFIISSGNLRVNRNALIFLLYYILFLSFCYLSSIWSTNVRYVFDYTNHIFKSFFGILAVYLCVKNRDIKILLKSLVWGGYFIVGYYIFRYGINGIASILTTTTRLDNEVMNANVFGMAISFACVIHIYFGIINKRIYLSHLLMIPSIVLLAASGSRKGFIVLIGGIVLVLLLYSIHVKKSARLFINTLIVIAVFSLGVLLIIRLPMFSFINQRFRGLLSLFSGGDDTDQSLITRMNYIEIGMSLFKTHPILGVGINNARVFNYNDVYLHNNYVELLADGGIVGFTIYYSFYAYLLIGLLKNRKKGQATNTTCYYYFQWY